MSLFYYSDLLEKKLSKTDLSYEISFPDEDYVVAYSEKYELLFNKNDVENELKDFIQKYGDEIFELYLLKIVI